MFRWTDSVRQAAGLARAFLLLEDPELEARVAAGTGERTPHAGTRLPAGTGGFLEGILKLEARAAGGAPWEGPAPARPARQRAASSAHGPAPAPRPSFTAPAHPHRPPRPSSPRTRRPGAPVPRPGAHPCVLPLPPARRPPPTSP